MAVIPPSLTGALGKFAPRLLFVALATGVFGTTAAVLVLVGQVRSYHGIDAHPAQVTATVAGYHRGRKLMTDTYTVEYRYGSQQWSARVPLSSGARIHDEVCVEIDVMRPGNARACGATVNWDAVVSYGAVLLVGTGGMVPYGLAARRRSRALRRAHEVATLRRARPLADTMASDIAAGRWPAKTALPEIAVLARSYGTDVPTMDAALNRLLDRGLVRWWLAADGKTFEWVPVDPVTARWVIEGRA